MSWKRASLNAGLFFAWDFRENHYRYRRQASSHTGLHFKVGAGLPAMAVAGPNQLKRPT